MLAKKLEGMALLLRAAAAKLSPQTSENPSPSEDHYTLNLIAPLTEAQGDAYDDYNSHDDDDEELIDWDHYIRESLETERLDYSECGERAAIASRQLHAVLGITTEAGELLDVFKKAIFYGRNVDWENVKEEIGDIMWYIAILCDDRGLDLAEILEMNRNKLHKRYEGGFSEGKANERNLEAEREAMIGDDND